jgi:CubicO group peptidase (beta-lactamase class C family)
MEQRMTPEALAQFDSKITAYSEMSRPFLQSVLVLHCGNVISEHYWRGFAESSYQPVYSITKTVVSSLIGIALGDGKLSLSDTLANWFPELALPPEAHAASVTIHHLLSMSAGFQELSGRVMAQDSIPSYLRRAGVSAAGETFRYASEDVDILAAVLERAVGEPAIDYAQKHLFKPLGIWPEIPKSFRKRLWKTDKQKRIRGALGLQLRSREMANFGQLYLQKGNWEGEQLLPAEFVAASTSPQSSGGYPERVKYGYLWWISTDREGRSAFFASGAGGQCIYVLPALELVIAFTSTLKNMDGRPHRVSIVRYVTDLFDKGSG